MLRVFLLLIFSICFLDAQMRNVELLADNVKKDGNFVRASGGVVVYAQSYFITARRAVYDEISGDLELFDDVSVISEDSDSIKSDYIKLNIQDRKGDFRSFFIYNNQKDVWIDCKSASLDKKFYMTKNSIISSCNAQEPDWKIAFSKGRLDKKTRFLQLYNVVFYARDIPFFYFPYFMISTNTTRKSGLLIPFLKYGSKDGMHYEQPIYIAEYDNWDLEINPQIRTNRGYGMYSTFRFVDSPHSKGSISIGAFEDKDSYAKRENLKNNTHWGYEAKYQNNKILEKYLSKDTDDGLLLDFIYLNDIDYLNLRRDKSDGYGSLVKSKLNYFLREDNYYIGAYAKYYIDTSKISNDYTIQELPTLQYHRFENNILLPNLLYSLDLQYHNYARKEGVNAQQMEINIPVTFYTSLFDDFLHLSVSENIFATYVAYSHNGENASDTLMRNYHKISLYSDLAKAYPDFFHTMKFGFDYIIPSWQDGNIEEDFIRINSESKNLKLSLVQFVYDKDGKKRLQHSIKQTFYQAEKFYKYGDLENFILYYLSDNVHLKNELKYSYEKEKISKFQTSLNLEYKDHSANLMHTYKYDLNDREQNFLIASFKTKYLDAYTFFGNVDYNLKQGYAQSWKLGLKREKKCWNFAFHYRQNISPKLTSAGGDNVKKNGFYVSFELYPLGVTEYDFARETSLR